MSHRRGAGRAQCARRTQGDRFGRRVCRWLSHRGAHRGSEGQAATPLSHQGRLGHAFDRGPDMKQNAHYNLDKAGNKMQKTDALRHDSVSGAGAPESIFSRQLGERLSHLLPPTPHGSGAEPMVVVLVDGVRFRFPEQSLSAAASLLRLSTGARAGLEDYGEAACRLFLALENRGLVSFSSKLATRFQDGSAQ
jgi:hypothetical protein